MGINLRYSPLEWNSGTKKFEIGGEPQSQVAASVDTVATPASGSCGVQFTFKDAYGAPVTEPIAGTCYIATDALGLDHAIAGTSFAVLTNGALTNIAGAGPSLFTTTAAGLLGVTITAVADDYWVVFLLSSGKLISTVCTCSA